MRDRVPPHNLEAEQAVLGAILIGGAEAFLRVTGIVTAEDFYRHAHQLMYRGLAQLAEAREELDLLTLKNRLGPALVDECGGPVYLASLVDGVPRSTNVEHYARIVVKKARLRAVAAAGQRIAEAALTVDDDEAVVDLAEAAILGLAGQASEGALLHMARVSEGALGPLENLHLLRDNSGISGIPTGFLDLDRRLSGLQRKDLVIIGARPSMGKTALALNIAEHVAGPKVGLPVAVFSLEMSKEQLFTRHLCSAARIDGQRLRGALLDEPELCRLAEAIETVRNLKIWIDDSSGLSVMDIRSRARRLTAEVGRLGAVIIDYLQLMDVAAASGRAGNRALDLAVVTRALKGLAKELDCPILLLSQLSRAATGRSDNRPVLTDLRESGAIEQDADVVVLIHREEMHNPTPDNRGVAEAIIAKQRNGPVGTVDLAYVHEHTRFENLTRKKETRS